MNTNNSAWSVILDRDRIHTNWTFHNTTTMTTTNAKLFKQKLLTQNRKWGQGEAIGSWSSITFCQLFCSVVVALCQYRSSTNGHRHSDPEGKTSKTDDFIFILFHHLLLLLPSSSFDQQSKHFIILVHLAFHSFILKHPSIHSFIHAGKQTLEPANKDVPCQE